VLGPGLFSEGTIDILVIPLLGRFSKIEGEMELKNVRESQIWGESSIAETRSPTALMWTLHTYTYYLQWTEFILEGWRWRGRWMWWGSILLSKYRYTPKCDKPISNFEIVLNFGTFGKMRKTILTLAINFFINCLLCQLHVTFFKDNNYDNRDHNYMHTNYWKL